jgi:hypothetical protein
MVTGWAAGCLALALSWPLYPYPTRATLTLAIPLAILTAWSWSCSRRWITWLAAVASLAALCAGPAWEVRGWHYRTQFHADRPTYFLSGEHRAVIADLARASPEDVLLCDMVDAQWLGVEYPGRFFLGYWFLTVDVPAKEAAWRRFLGSSPREQAAFLDQTGARWVFVRGDVEGTHLAPVEDLRLVRATRHGSLYAKRAS